MARARTTSPKKPTKPKRRPRPPLPPMREQGAFGPEFFTQVLPKMVHAIPGADRHPPACSVYLGNGDVLDVAEVLAVADRFAVLAVFEGAGEDGIERTEDDVGIEAVPYDLVLRVSVRRSATHHAPLGFRLAKEELAVATKRVSHRRRKDAAEAEDTPEA